MRAYVMTLLLVCSAAVFVASPSPDPEVTRIRAHFDSVLVELAASDISSLTPQQRSNRARLVSTLRTYRDDGAFPKNYDFPGREVPYFVDRKTGVRCAVGHLLESSGRGDIVERVRAANNNVRVAELEGDTAFTAWLDSSGLTLDEAARIQPTYGGATVDNTSGDSYRNASIAAISLSAVSTAWNLTGNKRGESSAASVMGLVLGTGAIGLGALAGSFSDGSSDLAWTNGVVGTASVVASVRGLIRQRRDAQRTPAATAEPARPSRGDVEASVSPVFSLAGQRSTGVAVNVRF